MCDTNVTTGKCVNTIGSYKCECIDGYDWDGITCKGKTYYDCVLVCPIVRKRTDW